MASKIDLHVHTTASDGTITPKALVAQAKAAGIGTLAVTDHDTVAGVAQARTEGERLGVEVLPGIEISADYNGVDTHILGYGIDVDDPHLGQILTWVIDERNARNEKIAALMRADGIDVTIEALEERYPGATIGRPHFARAMVEQGRAASVPEAFQNWLSRGKPYYLPRVHLSMEQAVAAIRRSGGIAVLAHPLQYRYSDEGLRALVARAAGLGVAGMEIYYTGYTPEQRETLHALAREFGLIVTGGSDFHGDNKPQIRLGALEVPGDILLPLNAKLAEPASDRDPDVPLPGCHPS